MLLHGAKDGRVPIEQAEFLRNQFDKIGKPYEWYVEDREGHAFYKSENRLKHYLKQLDFLVNILEALDATRNTNVFC